MAKGKEFIQSSRLILIGNYSNVFLTLIISVILSRLLQPSDFGIMAIIAVMLSLIQVLGNSGMSTALIQFGSIMGKDSISGLLVIISTVSVLLGISLYLAADSIESWLGYSKMSTYLKILSPLVFFTILSGAFRALLFSNKSFKEVATGSVVATAISGVIGISLAYLGHGVMSLVYKSIIFHVVLFLFYMLANKRNIGRLVNFNFPKDFGSFIINGMYGQLIGFLMRNLDTLLVGKFLGEVALGLYDVSYKIMRQPVSNVAKVFTPVIQPLFRSYEMDELYLSYTRIARLMGLVGFGISIPFVVWGDDIFAWVYGEKWLEGAPLFKILSISVFFHLLLSGAGGVMLAKNYQGILSRSMTYSFISTIGCILLGVFSGNLTVVAWLYVLSVVVNFFQSFYLLFKHVFKNVKLILAKGEFVFSLVASYLFLYFSYFLVLYLDFLPVKDLVIDIFFSLFSSFLIFWFSLKYNSLREIKYVLDNLKR